MEIKNLPLESVSILKPLWEKLRAIHVQDAENFRETYSKKTFEERIKKFGKLGKENVQILAVYEEETIVGYCISSIDREAMIGEIDSLYMSDDSRKSGMGSKLCELSLQWQKEQGCERFIVGVAEGHESVFAFYNKLGYYKRLTYLELIDE